MRSFPPMLLAAAAVLATSPALGSEGWLAQVVLFEDGRRLEVAGAEQQGEMALLTLASGGRMQIPSSRIANWEELGPPRPAPARPATQAVPGAEPWRAAAGDFAALFEDAALRHGLDPALLTAVALAESNLDPAAVSHKGACGLLQLMPATARRFGVADPFDPVDNVEGGARYLRWLLERFEGRQDLALAGYNAGEGTVDRYRGIPPYPETRNYVARVLQGAARLAP